MPKFKKTISLLLTLTMITGLVSFGAFADDDTNPEITYWNANSERIILDISEEVGAEALADAMTLTNNGAEVSFTVKERIPTTQKTLDDDQVRSLSYDAKGYREALVADTDYTYEIYPDGGMVFDEIYILTIGEQILGTEWKKGISVEKLWRETFDNYESIDVTPWMASHSTKLTLEGTTDKYLRYLPGGKNAGPRVGLTPAYKYVASSWLETIQDTDATAKAKRDAIFADTNTASRTFWASQVNEREYNLELEIAVEPTTAGTKDHGIQIYMGNRTNYGGRWAGSFIMAGAGLKEDLPADKDNAILGTSEGAMYRMYAGTINLFAAARSTSSWGYQVNGSVAKIGSAVPGQDSNLFNYMGGAAYSADKSDSVIATSDLTDDDLTNDVTNKISMSVKDKNIKFTIDSPDKSGFTSYDYTQGLVDSSVLTGLPVIVLESYGYNDSYYHIDNIIATKAHGYEVKAVKITPKNGSEDVEVDTPVSLDFGAPLDEATISQDTIIVYKDGSIVTDYSVSVNRDNPNVADIVFEDGMDYRSEYTIAIDGVFLENDETEYYFDPYECTFTTIAPEFEISSFSAGKNVDMSNLKKGTYNVTAVIKNNRLQDGVKGVATICLFDEYMTMIDFEVKKMDIAPGENDTISDTWEIPEDGKYTAACYLWDSFSSMEVKLFAELN